MGHRDIRPTFPISEADTWKQKAQLMGRSPVTMIAGIAALVALGSCFVVPWWLGCSAAALILGGFGGYWRKKFDALREQVRQHLIEESNRAQDRSLSKGVEQLDDWDYEDLAEELKHFVSLKQKAEAGIHQAATLTSMGESMEKLVDTLCNEVSRDLFKIADLRYTLRKRSRKLSDAKKEGIRQDQEELLQRITIAKETLIETVQQLNTTAGAKATNQTEGDNVTLDRTIEKLREEAALVKRIRDRVNETHHAELWPASSEFIEPHDYAMERE